MVAESTVARREDRKQRGADDALSVACTRSKSAVHGGHKRTETPRQIVRLEVVVVRMRRDGGDSVNMSACDVRL
jgi:hypothetical protein